jgi:hypothetical protein
MPGIWMIFFFCPHSAGRYGVLSDGYINTLRTPSLHVIRTTLGPVVLSVDLTGRECGLVQRGPPT